MVTYLTNSFRNAKHNVHITQHWGAVTKTLFPWKSNKYYIFLCVCVCLRVHAHQWGHAYASIHQCACMWAGEWWCKGIRMCLCACSLTNPVYNVLVPYCLWPLLLHHIFQCCFINGTISKKKVTEHKMRVLSFFTTFILNISHSKTKSAWYCHKCKNVLM